MRHRHHAEAGLSPETIHAYALLNLVEDYLRLGWLPHYETLAGTYHGQYSMHVEFICSCGRQPVRPILKDPKLEK